MFHMGELTVAFPLSSPSLFIFFAHTDTFTTHMLITAHTLTTLTLVQQHMLHQLSHLSPAMLISIDIYHKNANKAELTVRTAVSVKPARKPEISAELTAPVSHLRPA